MRRYEFSALMLLCAAGATAFGAMSTDAAVALVPVSRRDAPAARPSELSCSTAIAERRPDGDGASAPARIRVSLELERSAALDAAWGPLLGAECSARLVGQLVGAHGEPVVGVVRFVAGANRGRRVAADTAGRFAIHGLFPGCNLVEVERAGACVARRELRLAPTGETRLHLAWAGARSLSGRVVDGSGEPIADAAVHVDGRVVRSDRHGSFAVEALPLGVLSVDVIAAGFASVRQRVSLRPTTGARDDVLRITMSPEARLELCPPPGVERTVRIWVLPANAAAAASTPWDHFGELAMEGTGLRLRGLPAGPVNVYAHGVGQPGQLVAERFELRQGTEARIVLPPAVVAPSVCGVVARGTQAVAGAVIESRSPAPRSDSAARMQLPAAAFDVAPLPLLPPTFERVAADDDGLFWLSTGGATEGWRQLRVAIEGAVVVDRPLWAGHPRVHIDLAAADRLHGSLAIDLGHQGRAIDVELERGGVPGQVTQVLAGQQLVIDALPCGTWVVRVSQGAVDLLQATAVLVTRDRRQFVSVAR